MSFKTDDMSLSKEKVFIGTCLINFLVKDVKFFKIYLEIITLSIIFIIHNYLKQYSKYL